MESEYAKAAELLGAQGIPRYLAKIDGTVNNELMARFDITVYPKLYFYA